MPLLCSPKNVQRGDFVVFLYFPDRNVRSGPGIPGGNGSDDIFYDWIEVCLGTFHDLPHSKVVGNGLSYILTPHSECKFDASSYSGREFCVYDRRFKTLYFPNSIELFGIVNGHLAKGDDYSVKQFLREVIKRYRPVILHKLQEYMEAC